MIKNLLYSTQDKKQRYILLNTYLIIEIGTCLSNIRCSYNIVLLIVGVGCMRGKKGHVLGFFWGPPRFVRNVILITKVKKISKSVKNSTITLRFLSE